MSANREGYYSFSIRTMQEYFAGTFLVKGIGDEEVMQNIRDIAYKSYWRNVLLFALGYIELEKKNLEKEIGNLCYEMNGRDNIIREEYTVDNICLFGSWLALDILSEDIFKGKEQNKYIEIATKALSLYRTSNYNRFANISGVQFKKMYSYIKEKYLSNKDFHEEIFELYIKLAENQKNQVELMLDELLDKCDENNKITFCIQIIENSAKFNPEWVLKWEKQLIIFILEGKIKQFLSKHVVMRLLQNTLIKSNTIMQKYMFEQSVFNREISTKYIENIFEISWLDQIRGWLSFRHREKGNAEINVTPTFKYRRFLVPTEENIEKFKNFAEKINAQYFIVLCEYVQESKYDKYVELLEVLEQEPLYLKERYKRSSIYRAPYSSKDVYEEYQKSIDDFCELFNEDKIRECMNLKICSNINFAATCTDSVFDTLYEKFNFELEEFSELNDEFFRSFIFAAYVQIESTESLENIQEFTLNRLLTVFYEVVRRQGFAYYGIMILIVLLNTKYKEDVLKMKSYNFYEESQLINQIGYGQNLVKKYSCITIEHLNYAISSIIQNCIFSAQENNFLQLLPLLMYKNINCSRFITENDIKELKKINYENSINEFVVCVLKLYCDLGDITLVEEMLNFNLDNQFMYSILLDVFENCKISQCEQIGVKLYLMLENVEFKERDFIQQRLIEKMIENRCDILK